MHTVKRRKWSIAIAAAACAAVLAISLPQSAVADTSSCEGQGNATLVMKGNTEIGSRLKFKIGGAPHERYKLYTAFGIGPTEVPGLGSFCLDFSQKQVVQQGRFGPAGVRSAFWDLPADPQLVGEIVSFQAASTDPDAPNGVAISNAYSFPLAAEGSNGDVCDENSCGIATIQYIAPVYILNPIEGLTEILVRIEDADSEQLVDEVAFQWSADSELPAPIASTSGLIQVTKVTHHADAVVVFVTLDATSSDDGVLPTRTLLEAYVGQNELIREIDLSCDVPVSTGTKLAPLFVRGATPAECATDCPITLDFETEDDFATPLANGQDIYTPGEFGILVAISSSGNNQGGACFDSSSNGPNAGGGDPDLLVDLGNVLILQSNSDPEQTVPGFFDTPNDSASGGTLVFDFAYESQLFSIDLIDSESGQGVQVTLTDSQQRVRVYDVPGGWTGDVAADPVIGYGTLDLTTLDDQVGYESTATAAEDDGFDTSAVIQLEVYFEGSGATDNIVLCPGD